MIHRVRDVFEKAYERLLRREVGEGPTHVAIIQDGNRRYARESGDNVPEGHRAGASTTEAVLNWCTELGIEELTLYAFSTENFNRPEAELNPLFDLIETKLREFADAERVHAEEVCIRAIGDLDRLPDRVQQAVSYAQHRTEGYDDFRLNIALAYGGRNELLRAARDVTTDVAAGELASEDVTVDEIENRLYQNPVRDVDLIIRTGGDERTSNFLPWHANGNEAAVYFCAPYWPEFSRVDFLRAVRTYEHRERSWQRTRIDRAVTLVDAVARVELEEARAVTARLRGQLPRRGADEVSEQLANQDPDGSNDPAD